MERDRKRIDDRPTRRSVLGAVVALVAAALLPKRPDAAERRPVVRVAGRLGASAGDLGARYLRAEPAEASLAALEARLVERLRTARGSTPARLAAAARADFRSGDVVRIDGWVCSRTEARVCAVAHLLHARESR